MNFSLLTIVLGFYSLWEYGYTLMYCQENSDQASRRNKISKQTKLSGSRFLVCFLIFLVVHDIDGLRNERVRT